MDLFEKRKFFSSGIQFIFILVSVLNCVDSTDRASCVPLSAGLESHFILIPASIFSFLVNPEIIPGRMTLLVTIFLVLINIHNTIQTNSPKVKTAMSH